MTLQLIANEENQDRGPVSKKWDPAGWYRSFVGRENMWLTPPPMIDSMMPDFTITPEISPMRIYQAKWNILYLRRSPAGRRRAAEKRGVVFSDSKLDSSRLLVPSTLRDLVP
jgi:hypothetical protein